jgi:hypothetical protein
MNAIVQQNTITSLTPPAFGFEAVSSNSSTLSLALHNNSSVGGTDAYRVRANGTSTFNLEVGPAPANLPEFTAGDNSGSGQRSAAGGATLNNVPFGSVTP